jgi:hypothetical protein
LSFKEGQIITIVVEPVEGWAVGEIQGGKRGMFPVNYTEKLS